MRQVISLLLASILTFQAVPVAAQDVDSSPTLEERLHNMDVEAERFLRLKTAVSKGLVLEQETPATDESTETERARAILLNLERGTKISVVLRDGKTVQGRLVETTEDVFCINVEQIDKRGTNISRSLIRREFRFDQVKRMEYPDSREKVQEIPMGKRVEVVLLNGEKVKGHLLDVTEQGFTLNLKEDATREFTFDEVISVRKLGMRTRTKILIAIGIALPLLFLLGYYIDIASGA